MGEPVFYAVRQHVALDRLPYPFSERVSLLQRGMPTKTLKRKQQCPQCGALIVRLRPHTKRMHGGHWHAGVKMRSSWEVRVAQHLDSLGLAWKYEDTKFRLKDGRGYIPDFHVFPVGAADYYLEVKGKWRRGGEAKFLKFQQEYPQVRFDLWDGTVLRAKGIL